MTAANQDNGEVFVFVAVSNDNLPTNALFGPPKGLGRVINWKWRKQKKVIPVGHLSRRMAKIVNDDKLRTVSQGTDENPAAFLYCFEEVLMNTLI